MNVVNAGGAAGIGLETARVLALRGAHVIIGARNMEAGNEAKQLILNAHKRARVEILKLDLCSFASIREFVQNFNALDLPLNILMYSVSLFTSEFNHFYLCDLTETQKKKKMNCSTETMLESCSAHISFLKKE